MCPGCYTVAKSMLVFKIALDRLVCAECFDKVRAAERAEQERQQQSQMRNDQ
jgi:hypothetical protein